jgi:ubiquinone/menaquinone biosynthesis C-methylase UbiE
MPDPVEFTGERFLPECTGEIWVEHWHRYLFAAPFVAGRDVLDAACGEGYGSAWLARTARSVTGLDIDVPTVRQARDTYPARNVRFEVGSVAAMPFGDASFDCAVSFETLEHIAEQEAMLGELRRVLRPDGLLIISTPNRPEYSDRRGFHNEFHVRELDEGEFHALIGRYFAHQRWFGQKLLFNSGVWPLGGPSVAKGEWTAIGEASHRLPVPMYFIALASASPQSIPAGAQSLLADPDEAIYREYEQTVSRGATLEQLVREREALVTERDRQLLARNDQVVHLESLLAQREQIIEERDRQLAAQSVRAASMEQLISQRDRELQDRNRRLDEIGRRASTLEALVTVRERIIVERDAELAAINARIDRVERLVVQRDGELAATNARMAEAERLIAHRESVVVERDRQLEATNQRAAALESLLVDRERLIVERDAELAAARVSAAAEMARTAENIAALEAAKRNLQLEVIRRGGLRWWLALPLVRLRRALHLGTAPSEGREA